jgi:hypothetical protein
MREKAISSMVIPLFAIRSVDSKVGNMADGSRHGR